MHFFILFSYSSRTIFASLPILQLERIFQHFGRLINLIFRDFFYNSLPITKESEKISSTRILLIESVVWSGSPNELESSVIILG